MPRGSKSKYTTKQKRMAKDIEKGYEKRAVPEKEAERRAWATVNKKTGGGKKAGATAKKTATRSSTARKTTAGARGKATTASSRKATRSRSRATA